MGHIQAEGIQVLLSVLISMVLTADCWCQLQLVQLQLTRR